jgi:hypothetical protein
VKEDIALFKSAARVEPFEWEDERMEL